MPKSNQIMKEIPIDKEIEAFRNHLNLNKRTIFSAKFGDGKTYFLKHFMQQYKDEYYFITLYPVNYSVAQNEDIFEYIKRDILLQLAIDKKLDDIDFEALADSIFTWENLREVLSFLLSEITIAGIPVMKVFDKAKNAKDKYKESKTNFDKYNGTFTEMKGGIYENNAYTILIKETIKTIQTQRDKQRKCVLVIEDLDRIDPAHLFRILNVLGAHIDTTGGENKFGFDNIITVFDYDTTENIFHHFYGPKANYQGYINKFMSINPFNYSIKQVAIDYFLDFINTQCLININVLKRVVNPRVSTESMFDKIKQLSLRDIQDFLTNIDNQIIADETYTLPNGITINTKQPIVYFLALIKRMNLNYDIYYLTDFLSIPSNSFNILNAFLLHEKQLITFGHYITQGGKHFIFSHDTQHNYQLIEDHYGTSSLYELKTDKQKFIQKAIELAKECIK